MFTKDLMAASATPIVLSILSRADSYGYAIIEQVRRCSDGDLSWKDGMLYPILYRLETKGLIESYSGASDSGRKRKYYRILNAGREALDIQRAQWRRIHHIIDQLEVT